ncbi:hypothetical protein AB3M83_13085 [Microbacterium sp. 179-B 1A2 NHS]|uniref:hypothetical protein n=1 Tax=Microbacterium sp. 179-B 1A2 NHS TaxID=3142383 RepID=UPI00399FAABD
MPRIAPSIASAAAGLVLASAIALAGCSTAAPEVEESQAPTASAPAVAPAAGGTVEGDAYVFSTPEGWGFPEEAPEGYDETMFSADLTDTDDFTDNLNVITSPAGEITPEQVESDGVAELENVGATDVTVLDRVTAGGVESAHLTAGFASPEGVEYTIDQYYLTDAGQTHIVTFSFSPDVPQEDRDALAQSVLATWQWK